MISPSLLKILQNDHLCATCKQQPKNLHMTHIIAKYGQHYLQQATYDITT